MILYEVTAQVRNLCVKMLFNTSPTIGRICEVIGEIFADNTEIHHGMVELILSMGDDADRRDTIFNVGDEMHFTDDSGQIGYMDLQTRTLFDA